MYSSAVLTALALLFLAVYKLVRIGRREAYPPHGPPTVPILGNLGVFPTSRLHIKFTEWARIYGGIYSLKLGHLTTIIITDMDAVKDLMEKHAQTTASRPPFFAGELITGGMHMAISGHTDNWRIQKRLIHEALTQNACAKYVAIQQAESTQLLYDCLHTPKEFLKHTNRYSFSVILSIMFGKRAPYYDMQDVSDFHEMERRWNAITLPGAIPPVDFLPFLKFVPKRFAKWKVECDEVQAIQHKLFFGLLHETQKRVAQGGENGCFMEQILARQIKFGLTQMQVAYLGGVMIQGGAGTSAAWIKVLIMAMATHPEAQKKAQAELDRVIGTTRMPVLADISQLPYIQAVIKEVNRWRPIAPVSAPHATTEEILYAGYRIPAGTTIFTNTWGMSHDPDLYERPEDFWPDRWLHHKFGLKPDAANIQMNPTWFGCGRRLCPGTHLANNSLAINTMNLLWAFNFGHDIDLYTGNAIGIDTFGFEEGLESSPKAFRCSMTPRSLDRSHIVAHEFSAARRVFERYELNLSAEEQAKLESQYI